MVPNCRATASVANLMPAGERVRFPRGLARKLIATAPSDYVQHARNPERSVHIGGKDTVFVYVFPDLGPTFVTVCKVSLKPSGSFDYTLDCSIPPIKTLPSAPDASVVTVKTKTEKKTVKKSGKKYPLIVAPKKCSGTWKTQAQFFFATGTTVTTKYSGKCSK